MTTALDRVIDALDVETFLACRSEEEGRRLAAQLMKELGFKDVDIMFGEFIDSDMRVRARAYLHRPGDYYPWLPTAEPEEANV